VRAGVASGLGALAVAAADGAAEELGPAAWLGLGWG